MKRFFLIALSLLLLIGCNPQIATAKEYTDEEISNALQQAINEYGEVYTWSFEDKAYFYNKYVYHNQGPRRGVPDESCIEADTILEIAKQFLQNYLADEGTPSNLSNYLIDIDFWIECFQDQDREHEYYSVCFIEERKIQLSNEKRYVNRYQFTISPYSGAVLDFWDIRKETAPGV